MNKQAGFTLIELMIVVAIIAILAAIATPLYRDYLSRTRASAATTELAGIRTAVAECVTERQTLAGCDAGTFGIPAVADFAATLNVLSLDSITNGVITATTGATDAGTGTALDYIVAPTIAGTGAANITWANTGSTCNTRRGLRAGQGGCP